MKKLLCCLMLGLFFFTVLSDITHAVTLRPDQEANFDGLNFMKDKEYDKAIEKFTLAIKTAPQERRENLATYHANRAVAYRKIQDLKASLADLDKAAEFNADAAHVWSQRANTLYDLHRYSEAQTDASKALLINPHDFVALNARALAGSALERYDDAISDYTRALALKQDPVVYVNRAGAYREQKLWNQALSDYETALQIKPDESDALIGRAITHLHMKRFDAVISGSEKALKNQDTAMLRIVRGMAQQGKARWSESIAEYDAALKKEPGLSLAAALRELARQKLPIDFQGAVKTKISDAAPPLPRTGEIRLQGILKSVDATQSRLTMEAVAFTLPSGKTAPLTPAKQKEVVLTPQTQILPFAGMEQAGALDQIKMGATIWVIGPDKGSGTALAVRWLGSAQQAPQVNSTVVAIEPKLPMQAIGHPRFVKNDGKIWSAGTAFLVRWDTGDPVLLTAHHLLGPAGGLEKEIPPGEVAMQIKTVRFNDFLNRFVSGTTTQVMALSPLAQPAPDDQSRDMVAFRFTPEAGAEPGKELQVLPLATANPAVNEPLWLVGRASGEKRAGTEGVLLYPARAVLSEDKRLVIQMKEAVPGRGFSGAPVVNAKGEVVGLMLSSSQWMDVNFFVCNPVSALRARLAGP